MSSLNIDDLYGTIKSKNENRLKKFNNILQKIHSRIKYNAKLEKTYCFFHIPEFIIGVPLYNVNDLKNYIINSLSKNGFKIMYIEPNWLFISWDLSIKKDSKKVNNGKSKPKDYKLIDEYKPSGTFVNEPDLSVIKDKTKQLF